MNIKRLIANLAGVAGLVLTVACAGGGTTSLHGAVLIGDEAGSDPSCSVSGTDGDLCLESELEVQGASTLTGNVTASGTLAVTGTSTLTGHVTLAGGQTQATATISDTDTLVAADCGIPQLVTAGIDTKTITLPATIDGCVYTFMYTGADGGALLDISPNASDAIHGSCTLAASVLEFNGTDDNDIGLTKATANTGDTITLLGDGSAGWYVTTCTGIWANN